MSDNIFLDAARAKSLNDQSRSSLYKIIMDKRAYEDNQQRQNKLSSILFDNDIPNAGFSVNGVGGEDKNKKTLSDNLIKNGFIDEGIKIGNYQQQDTDAQLKDTNARMKMAGQSFGWLKDNATPENAKLTLDSLSSSGLLSQEKASRYLNEIQEDPGIIKNLADFGYASSISSADHMKNATTTRGQDLDYKTAQERNATAVLGNNLSYGAKIRGQDLDYKTAQERNDIVARGQDVSSKALNRRNELYESNNLTSRILAQNQNTVKLTSDLRKEWNSLPEVETFKKAIPAYNALVNATERNTPQSDIDILYAIAKIYDPDSVVREGEYATLANSQAVPSVVKAWWEKVVGGERLSTETRGQLKDEALGRLSAYQNTVAKSANPYTIFATDKNLDYAEIFDQSLFIPIDQMLKNDSEKNILENAQE